MLIKNFSISFFQGGNIYRWCILLAKHAFLATLVLLLLCILYGEFVFYRYGVLMGINGSDEFVAPVVF